MKLVDKVKKNTILILIITIIVLYFILKDDFTSIVKAFGNIDIRYIIIAAIFYLLSIVFKGTANYLIVNDKKRVSLLESIKHNAIAQFFNGITPFETGGQPMEIYMLTEHGISTLKATNQIVQSFIFYQIALVLCGFFAVGYNYFFHIFPKVSVLRLLVLAGFITNILVVLFLLLISISKKTTTKIVNFITKVLKKIRIKIDEKEIEKKIEDYHKGFEEIKKRKGLTSIGILLNVGSLLCLYITPLFVVYGMHEFHQISVINTLTASAYVFLLCSFVPIPGSSGGIEYGFTQFFGNFIHSNIISAVLIIWRFITYYLGIIIGAFLFNIEKKVDKWE